MKDKNLLTSVKYGVFNDKLEANEYGEAAYILVAVFRMEADARWYAKHRNRIQESSNNVYFVVPVNADVDVYQDRLEMTAEAEEMIYSKNQNVINTFYSFSDAMEAERK